MDLPVELLLGKFGPVGLLSMFIVLMFFGRIVPKSTLDDVRAQRDKWEATAGELMHQNRKLLESARAADATFKALQQVAGKEIE